MKKLKEILFCIMFIVLIFPVQSSAYENAIQASISRSPIFVNECKEDMQSYNIGGYNYFKLRDLANAFRNTSSKFDVIWNAQKQSVEIITGNEYTPIEEQQAQNNYYASATPCQSSLYIDGQNVSIQAYTINGFNYFKLRDLSEHIPFDIKWDEEYSFIFITTQPIPNSYRVESLSSGIPNILDFGSMYGYPKTSHIAYNDDGTYTVIDARGNSKYRWDPVSEGDDLIYIATYDENFSLLKTINIERELDIYGGFYKGDDHYYMVFGQKNIEEDNSKEVFRIVKYSMDFKREGSASVYGKQCNTTKPFEASCTRMAHDGNLLVVHSSRERYTSSSDGLNHQSNITIEVNTDNMTVKSISEPFPENHVSHSFNQFIQFDNGKKVFVDHGDGYPRSVFLQKESSRDNYEIATMLRIYGKLGDNYTGVTMGGFEVSETKYLVAGSSVTQNENYRTDKTRNIFVSAVPKNNVNTSNVELTWLTDYSGQKEGNIYFPKFVKISDTLFMVLWQEGYTDELAFDHNGFQVFISGPVYYVYLDEDGNQLGDIKTIEYGQLSDCDPIYANGRVVWYSVKDETMTIFTIPVDER